jgi:hypothetical protein
MKGSVFFKFVLEKGIRHCSILTITDSKCFYHNITEMLKYCMYQHIKIHKLNYPVLQVMAVEWNLKKKQVMR